MNQTARALRRIEADLATILQEPREHLDLDALATAARRIGMQAEMIEEGLAE